MSNTNVLGHFQTRDLVILLSFNSRQWSVSVVAAHNSGLLWRDTVGGQSVVTELGLVLSKGDTGDLRTVLGGCKGGQSTPAATKVEHLVALLQTDLFTDNLELVVLQLLESLGLVNLGDHTRGVDHSWTQEPFVEVVTSVVVVSDLFLVLGLCVQQNFRNEAEQEEFVQTGCESESCPVVSVLHHVKSVTLERDLASEIELVESFHWDLVVVLVLVLELLVVEVEVELNTLVWKLDLLVESWGV
ncbi:hypothetical protein OGAPHI_002586 [Ogataea philodendri]|uniref:Uncharacterized protein n=1 Tax=Ogataea philodendri TaxID=1378263 RepID=A0A9P8PBP1_9ASCO|nr:uncharacterized protein OGAPHI_002586 [Ogataea philodendri]KAH3668831.1 hypothetical protein OGAPHI_002586 [Ogataea philodendri]